MDERENESLVAGGPRREAGPYTDPGNEDQDTLNGQVAATIRGLDRKLTDGLNLVHGQLDVMRHERLEDRRELRETRGELKAEIAAVEQKVESRFGAFEQKVESRFGAFEQKVESRFGAFEQKVESRFDASDQEVESRFTAMEQKLEGRSAGLERSFENRSTGLERRFDGLEQRFDAFEQKIESRFASLEEAIRELTALTSTALERSLGTRRLVRGVLGAFALLLAGGLLRPVFERAVQALLGG